MYEKRLGIAAGGLLQMALNQRVHPAVGVALAEHHGFVEQTGHDV